MSKVVKFIETESRMVVNQGLVGVGEMGSCCLVGTEFLLGKMRKVLEVDGHDGCTAIWIYLMPLNG